MTEYLTVKETAQTLDVSLQTVYRWIYAGHVTPERGPNGRYYFPAEAVEEFRLFVRPLARSEGTGAP
jgi:excisionase family DNA binding protein